MKETLKPFQTKTLARWGAEVGGEGWSQEGTTVSVDDPLKLL